MQARLRPIALLLLVVVALAACAQATPAGERSSAQRVPKAALGILRGADHLAIQRSGGGYLGYLTAWLMWQLQDDTNAGSAFVGPDRKRTEFRQNKRWQNQQQRGLA